ncbi:MAG: DNA-3-methyladenine glycosylase 2 family protein [Promicromonosporaceae bacterium]|nr:DNA-3-methyladenine glycosylase 2 family protein [Promicromonosporaceae bacterium]
MKVRYASERPLQAWRTLSQVRHGPKDPTFRWLSNAEVWRTSLLSSGPVTQQILQDGPNAAIVNLWGEGAAEAAETIPTLLGEYDDATGFTPPERVRETARRAAGMRMPRTGRVLESLIPAILEQRVQADAAHLSWRRLVKKFGTPAPGPTPTGLMVFPSPQVWAAIPSWEWHLADVDAARARTAVACARLATRLETAATLSSPEAQALLQKVPGIGPWTSAEVVQNVHGDADAVSLGDYNLPNVVGWVLARERTDEAGMLRLLAPYAPHRYRLIRVIRSHEATHESSRRGARMPLEDHRRFW